MLFVENPLCFHLVKKWKKIEKAPTLSYLQDCTTLAKKQREAIKMIQFPRAQYLQLILSLYCQATGGSQSASWPMKVTALQAQRKLLWPQYIGTEVFVSVIHRRGNLGMRGWHRTLVTAIARDHTVVLWSGCRQSTFYEIHNLHPLFSLCVKW